MFLANSLKEKLKKNYFENDSMDVIEQTKYPYVPKGKNPRQLLSFRQKGDSENQENLIPQNFFSTQKLQSLDRKEWESTFTIDKLRSEWKTRVTLDFENNFKKFSDDFALPDVHKGKEKIKNLVDPDRLNLKKKEWNISYNTNEETKPELEKQLFEIENGFKDFRVIPPKIKNVEPGVDTRDHLELDGKIWDISNQVSKKDFNEEEKKILNISKENSIKYWRNNDEMRQNESAFPLNYDKKKNEIIRYFKKYRTPYQKNVDYYRTMQKIKEDTFVEREQAEKKVKYKNPGAEKYPEKIRALVQKEMYNLYKYKYNEKTGKLSKEELLKKQKEKNRFRWSDIDLSNKIFAINELTGEKLVDNIQEQQNSSNINNSNNYNTINIERKINNKSFNIENNKNKKNLRESYSQENHRRDRNKLYLAPLVPKGTEIIIEEDKIKEKLNEEYKRKKRIEFLMNKKNNMRPMDKKFKSKFPLGKKKYENIKKKEKEENDKIDYKINDFDKINIKLPPNLFELATDPKKDSDKKQTLSTYYDLISRKTNCGPYFLEAYHKVAEKEIRRINSVEKKNRLTKTFEYMHPGTYREFIFTENDISNKDDNIINNNKQKTIKVKMNLWSCCLNADKNSRGCQKKTIRNFRWIYNP